MDLYYWRLNVWLTNLSLIFCHLYFLNTCSRPERVLNTQVPKETYNQREFTKSRHCAHFMFTIDYMMKRIKHQLDGVRCEQEQSLWNIPLKAYSTVWIWKSKMAFILWTYNSDILLEISKQLAGIQKRIYQFILKKTFLDFSFLFLWCAEAFRPSPKSTLST